MRHDRLSCCSTWAMGLQHPSWTSTTTTNNNRKPSIMGNGSPSSSSHGSQGEKKPTSQIHNTSQMVMMHIYIFLYILKSCGWTYQRNFLSPTLTRLLLLFFTKAYWLGVLLLLLVVVEGEISCIWVWSEALKTSEKGKGFDKHPRKVNSTTLHYSTPMAFGCHNMYIWCGWVVGYL